ncbi:hypothetical protein H6503_02590 [Candidatus Woesearchaeota archaeon]|nr:hypothetical protein [Candidatus Woesearchaeota archaeon]
MKREAEIILKVIGDDFPVYPKTGVTLLSLLSDTINSGEIKDESLNGYSIDRNDYKAAVIELVPYFNQMSNHAFQYLMIFCSSIGLTNDREIMEAAYHGNVLPVHNEDNLPKRASFLQYFAEVNPPVYDLLNEKEVRIRYPWQWIDASMFSNPDDSLAEIVNQLSDEDKADPFFWRLPSIVDKMPVEYLSNMLVVLSKSVSPELFHEIEQNIKV